MTNRYTLDENHNIVKQNDLYNWALWVADVNNRRVAYNKVGKYEVSTVFIGIDFNIIGDRNDPNYKPILFESMVFLPSKKVIGSYPIRRKSQDGYTQRYSTWNEALEGHNEIVQQIKLLKRPKKK